MSASLIMAICFASVTLYVSFYYLISYFRIHNRRQDLAFSLMCFSIVLYDLFSAALYGAGSASRGAEWQKWQAVALSVMGIFFLWFISSFVGRKSRVCDHVFSVYWLIQIIVLLTDKHGLTWSDVPAVKHVSLFNKMNITYYEVEPGILMKMLSLSAVLAMLYAIISLIGFYKRENRRITVPILIGVICLTGGMFNDIAISTGIYKSIYLLEFSYMCLVVCMAYALTEDQISAQKALRQSNEKFFNLLDSANDAIFIADAETGIVLDANRKAEDLTGLRKGEITGRQYVDLHPVEDRDRYEKLFKEQITMHGGCIVDDVYAQHRDGRKIPVEISTNVMQMGDRAVVQGIFRDISRRKGVESELMRLAAAVNAAEESIIVTDLDGIIQYVNPCFEKMTGYRRDEVIGKNPGMFKSDKHDKDFYDKMWATISGGKTWRGHFVNKKKDGKLFEEDAVVSPVCAPDGKIVNYVAVKRDVTKQIALEQQLRQSQKMEALGRFAGKIAHDFTNMLVIMFGHSQVLKDKFPEMSDAHENLDEIIAAASRASKLTSELLAFSHDHEVVLRNVDLNKAVIGVEEILRRTVGSGMVVKMHLPEEPLMVKADIAQIEQVIIHLVSNACEAMSAGGQLTIAGSCVRLSKDEVIQLSRGDDDVADGEFAVLSVSDNGTGMTDEVKARIFEPFFTTKKEKKSTGLGLSTVYGIVRQHGGCMTVYSRPGNGTTFEVYLPLRNDAVVQSNGQTESACGDETVLFVAEDSIMKMVGGKILRELGYSVLEATSGKQAINVCQTHEHPIHFMITDLFMSDMAGKDLAGVIRGKKPEMRVLFTSGYPKVHLVERAVVTMEDAVICRPFSKSTLASAIRNVLEA